MLQFGRLERVEVGGTKGKNLTSAIKQVHADFVAANEKFQQVSAVCWESHETMYGHFSKKAEQQL